MSEGIDIGKQPSKYRQGECFVIGKRGGGLDLNNNLLFAG